MTFVRVDFDNNRFAYYENDTEGYSSILKAYRDRKGKTRRVRRIDKLPPYRIANYVYYKDRDLIL